MNTLDVDALLFDLGGVLIEIDWRRAFASWSRDSGLAVQDIASRFSFDAAYVAHERGEIGAAQYLVSLRRSLGIDLPDAHFLAGWNSIFNGEVSGVRALLAAAAVRHPLHLFSNTCEVHRDHWAAHFADLLQPFGQRFLSCEIGMRKPDPEAFRHVARAIGVPPQRIAFFDDTAENVAAAARVGFAAYRVRSAAQLAAALRLSS